MFLSGIQADLPILFASDGFFRLEKPSDFESALTRLRGIETYVDQIMEVSREGIRRGVTYARESIGRAKEAFVSVIASARNDPTK